jgi:hypothetical protein
MTRKEFDDEIDRMADLHDMPSCPDDIKEYSWEKNKDMSFDEFKEHIQDWFQQMEVRNKLFEKYKDDLSNPDNAEEFMQEVNNYKREIGLLLRRLISSRAGHIVLEEMAEHCGLAIDIEELNEQASSITIKDEESDKCPDAITPEILKILKGNE